MYESYKELDVVVGQPAAVISELKLSSCVDGSGVRILRPFNTFLHDMSSDILALLVTFPMAGHFRFFIEFGVRFDPVHIAERLVELLGRAFAESQAFSP
jgi:hypothetical protein